MRELEPNIYYIKEDVATLEFAVGYYYSDETEGLNGPYLTQENAKAALDHYCEHVLHPSEKTQILDRITVYLTLGGLFNPEQMEHDKVRDLLLDCYTFIKKRDL